MAQKRPRICWKQEAVEKTFLEACLHEVKVNGWKGSSLKPNSWKNVAERLKTKHNFIADQKQLKNRYDYLKSKFTAWLKLKNKTGNVYDPTTNKFNLEEEQWQIEIKSNKYVEALRTSPLLYPDLCTQLFDSATPLGFYSWGPSSKLPHPSEGLSGDNFNGFSDVSYSYMEPSTANEDSINRSKNRGGKQKSKESIDSRLIEIGEELVKVARMLVENNSFDDMDACFKKLEKFEWGESDPRYNTAILLFGESAHVRKFWLFLKPELCENWLRNAERKYGLL